MRLIQLFFLFILFCLTVTNNYSQTNINNSFIQVETITIGSIYFQSKINNVLASPDGIIAILDCDSMIIYDSLLVEKSSINLKVRPVDNYFLDEKNEILIINKNKIYNFDYKSWEFFKASVESFFYNSSEIIFYNYKNNKVKVRCNYDGNMIGYDINYKENLFVFISYYKKKYYLNIFNYENGDLYTNKFLEKIGLPPQKRIRS